VTAVAVPVVAQLEELVSTPTGPRLVADVPRMVIIPAFNEEENLPRLFADLEARAGLFPAGSRILIVDDGSSDATPTLVRSYDGPLPVELVRLEQNQGPGAAFRAGFAAALAGCPEDALVVTLEADTTSDLDALPRMIARAEAGADVVLASWVMTDVAPHRRLLSAGASFAFRRTTGIQATTVSSFFRVYRAAALRTAFREYGERLIRERGFACKAEILAKLCRLGARVEEEQVVLDWSRREGKSKMPVLRTIFCYWRMLARMRFARGIATA
jgi:dolichol-phosphate mannosyltransferase